VTDPQGVDYFSANYDPLFNIRSSRLSCSNICNILAVTESALLTVAKHLWKSLKYLHVGETGICCIAYTEYIVLLVILSWDPVLFVHLCWGSGFRFSIGLQATNAGIPIPFPDIKNLPLTAALLVRNKHNTDIL
jgi:hypothetical protein